MCALRLIVVLLACGITQSVARSGGYPGLDRFGRVLDLHYQDANTSSSTPTVHRYQYGYDLAGNRTHCRVTQAPDAGTNGASHDNDRSWLYAYDALNRLVDAKLGRLTDSNTSIATSSPTPADIHWYLDNLGNWTEPMPHAGTSGVGGRVWTQGSASAFDRHAVNPANQITHLAGDYSTNGAPGGGSSGGLGGPGVSPVTVIHDPAGNMVFDGERYYQYDAFNHLLSVHWLGGASLSVTTGQIVDGELGELIARYAYDGLGRLIARYAPDGSSTSSSGTDSRAEHYYYDGIRRISEVRVAGLSDCRLGDCDADGTVDVADLPQFITTLLDGGTTVELCASDMNTDGSADGDDVQPMIDCLLADDCPTAPTGTFATDREYVYGPGDVDEFVCQIDSDGRALYMLQDANLNVVALVDCTTNGGGGGTGVSPVVLEQYTYDPYGQVLARNVRDADTNGGPQHAANHVGFQGLFFDRLDGNANDAALAVSTPTAPINGLYYARNRNYSPTLGRWMQRDPNETALPVITAMAMNGENALGFVGGFDLQGHYGDGMNLYQFASGNPVTHRDPLGLDDFDDAMDEVAGNYLYAVGMLNEGARAASVGLNLSLDIASSILGIDVLQSVQVLMDGKGGFWESMDLLMAVNPIGKVGKVLAVARKYKRMGRAVGKVASSIDDLLLMAHRWKTGGVDPQVVARAAERYPKKAGKIEVHHIIPQYLGGPANGPTVQVDAAYHQLITNEIRRRFPWPGNYGGSPEMYAKIEKELDEVYQLFPLPMK